MIQENFTNIIKCPYCETEYLPGEIYIPNNLVGQPKDISRTIEGKIDTAYGINPDYIEFYTCDKCNNTFKVNCKLTFHTSKDVKKNIDDEYRTNIYSADRLILKEN